MLTKLLKVCNLPKAKTYTPGINIKGEYLTEYGFCVGDYVHVEITENKIVITKDSDSNIISLFSKKNKALDSLIETFDLTPKHG